MLPLADLSTWRQLENPFGNSEDIPGLIAELTNAPTAETLNAICWEYIYHQNSLYEASFATIPYLVDICEKAANDSYKMAIFLNLGVILSEMDAGDGLLLQIFSDSKVDKETVAAIITSYKSSFERLKAIGQSLFEMVPGMDEEDKRYFLLTLATAYERYDVAKVFSTYSGNEEYMCSCPACDSEFHAWNEGDRLVLYAQDPVFTKSQTAFPITPRSIGTMPPTESISASPHFEWLVYYIDRLSIHSMQPVIGYLFGEAQCPECKTTFDVFNAVREPLF